MTLPPQPGLLTVGRRAVWDAIDNWPALQDAFRAKYRGEVPQHGYSPTEALSLRDAPTGTGELPAISVMPATNEFAWLWTDLGHNEYALAVTIWTPGWEWSLSEWLWEECIKACLQSKPGETVSRKTYISRPVNEGGTGHYPKILGSRFTRTRIATPDNTEGPKILAHTFGVSLKLNLQAIVD